MFEVKIQSEKCHVLFGWNEEKSLNHYENVTPPAILDYQNEVGKWIVMLFYNHRTSPISVDSNISKIKEPNYFAIVHKQIFARVDKMLALHILIITISDIKTHHEEERKSDKNGSFR